MTDSYSWAIASPMTSYGICYGPMTSANHSAQGFYAAARSRCAGHCAWAADDRLPVNSSRDQYDSPFTQQHQQPQELGWFSVQKMLIPANVGTTTTAMATAATTYLTSRDDDDVTGASHKCSGFAGVQ